MKHTLIASILMLVALGVQAQNDKACSARAYPSKVKGTVVLEYWVGANEGELTLIGGKPKGTGTWGSSSTIKDGVTLKAYKYCYAIPDSSHFWVPSAMLLKDGITLCSIDGHWVAVDTLDWDYMNGRDSLGDFTCEPIDYKKLYAQPDFAWVDGVEPEITLTVKNKVAQYDTVHLTIEANFPLDDLMDKLRIVNLMVQGIPGSKSKYTTKDGNVSGWFYSRTLVLYAGTRGVAMIEPFEYTYLGKTIKIKGAKVKVK